MEPDEAFKSLLESCSLYGLYRLLKALNRNGMMTASELARVTGLGSHAQTKKYLTLAMGLVAVSATRERVSDSPGSVLAVMYDITHNGQDMLQFLDHFDMSKTVLREPIAKKI